MVLFYLFNESISFIPQYLLVSLAYLIMVWLEELLLAILLG